MHSIHKYSLCFQPNDQIIETVKLMKLKLAEEIGWYNSKNSLAHLTIVEFHASETEIKRVKQQVERCCNRFVPTDVILNDFDTYPNGAFFLTVDTNAKIILQDYVKQLLEILQVKVITKSYDAHLSIARKLDAQKIEKAYQLFGKQHLEFLCNHIALRKFNLERRQYDIIDTFMFLSQPDDRPIQMELF
ncbi:MULTISPECIES: 2'-5' RNA ligase family protein [Myroides]|uniref:2'-5' RNA ligase family protein n=1 Tax=Myroides TaxID=76831 RepID=UPI0013038356|nr:2'-5' RNA ligase family protein [Myroides phaeus]